MPNDNTSTPKNLANGTDTPESGMEPPFLSDFLREVDKLSKKDKEANFEYLQAHKKWLDGLPKPTSDIETKKRFILNAYLVGALAARS